MYCTDELYVIPNLVSSKISQGGWSSEMMFCFFIFQREHQISSVMKSSSRYLSSFIALWSYTILMGCFVNPKKLWGLEERWDVNKLGLPFFAVEPYKLPQAGFHDGNFKLKWWVIGRILHPWRYGEKQRMIVVGPPASLGWLGSLFIQLICFMIRKKQSLLLIMQVVGSPSETFQLHEECAILY